MRFNRYKGKIILQALLLALTPLLLVLSIDNEGYIFTHTLLILIWAFQIWWLIRSVDIGNRSLMNFLKAFSLDDRTQSFAEKHDDPMVSELFGEFDRLISMYQRAKIQEEQKSLFVKNIVSHVDIGLMSTDHEGRVKSVNKSLQELLGIGEFSHISRLEDISNELPKKLWKMPSGSNDMIRFSTQGKMKLIIVRRADFELGEESIRLFSFQDIKNEMEEKEMEAWQQLIRVQAHEIMNSTSPITILSGTLLDSVEQNDKKLNPEDIEDLKSGLKVINKRSQGLTNFMTAYRDLTDVPAIDIQSVSINQMTENISYLLKYADFAQYKSIQFEIPEKLAYDLDEELIEQLLINLIKNACQADADHILVKACLNDKRLTISIRDNGSGIPEDKLEEIFIPFFTTKDSGSGIGLSLGRQIMRLHKGRLDVFSKEGEYSEFKMVF
ncbi:sensor histidine kinase [Aureibacter tunicatorum]|uniref:histidine kinase n=1 Tax=Aureibacter tunicatorum TaxID=866807 RepID=A0AAE3XM61_9BACT|nr:ATP-binding protein [Aureibacter tunicatorum]MDR6240456.1 nitrogen fixation/metabolism regulation signal transduction histidine kinase [Aureibacter tunicatorum]BDD05665.1 sensor histidine kinase [Aureibacter tunicatorum]